MNYLPKELKEVYNRLNDKFYLYNVTKISDFGEVFLSIGRSKNLTSTIRLKYIEGSVFLITKLLTNQNDFKEYIEMEKIFSSVEDNMFRLHSNFIKNYGQNSTIDVNVYITDDVFHLIERILVKEEFKTK